MHSYFSPEHMHTVYDFRIDKGYAFLVLRIGVIKNEIGYLSVTLEYPNANVTYFLMMFLFSNIQEY